MARLEKSFQDYFKLPILLEGLSPSISEKQSFQKLYAALNLDQILLPIDNRYQPYQGYSSPLLASSDRLNAIQKIEFKLEDFNDEWKQLQVIYRYRFSVAVYDIQHNQSEQTFHELWMKYKKQKFQENRKIVGLIILTTQQLIDLEAVQYPYIIIPEKLPQEQIIPFLQPWLYSCLAKAQYHLCQIISLLQTEEHNFIVFNKNQERPEQRVLKRKKKGRCLKISGDLCLMMHTVSEAYKLYCEAQQILKKIDDNLWSLGCVQGKIACLTASDISENKYDQIEEAREQCFILSKKVQISKLEEQLYFKILKLYVNMPEKFDKIAHPYSLHISKTHSNSQKFILIVQLAKLYKQAGLLRRYACLLYQSIIIVLTIKPKTCLLLLDQLKKQTLIKEWPLMYAHILQLEIDLTPNSSLLHLELLQKCSNYLSFPKQEKILQSLNYTGFHPLILQKPVQFIQLLSYGCYESEIKPKKNKISNPNKDSKASTGLLISWRQQKNQNYLFQQRQKIRFYFNIFNKLNLYFHVQIRLKFQGQKLGMVHGVNLIGANLNKIQFEEIFEDQAVLQLEEIHFRAWNFIWIIKCVEKIRLEIYEEYPRFDIQISNNCENGHDKLAIEVEQSSRFQLPLIIYRNKQDLELERVKLTASVYYHLDVGLQQTQFYLQQFENSPRKSCEYTMMNGQIPENNTTKCLQLKKFKVHQKTLKKIQLKLEIVRTANSKYQVTKNISIEYISYRNIDYKVSRITTPIRYKPWFQNLPTSLKAQQLIEQQYVIEYKVQKKENNRKSYAIKFEEEQYILSEQTTLTIAKKYSKISQKLELQSNCKTVNLLWQNITNKLECGTFSFDISYTPLMTHSPIKIDFELSPVPKASHQILQVASQKCLTSHYRVSNISDIQIDLSHQFIIQPLNNPEIRKFLISGKRVVAANNAKQTQNRLKVKFVYEYKERYAIGIKFRGGQFFWYQDIIEVAS